MFEKFNEYGAIHYGSLGRKTGAYNTKLKKSLLMEEEGDKFQTTVLVQPYLVTDSEKQMLEQKAKREGYNIQAYISEPVAAALYYTNQHPEVWWDRRVGVINIHKDSTEISSVNIKTEGIKVESHESIYQGGELLTEKLKNYYTRKLRQMDGDVLNYAKERHFLYDYAREAAFRLASSRLEEDTFTFVSPQTGKKYQLSIKRREFDELMAQIAKEILQRADPFDCRHHGIILCGGMAEYDAFADVIKKNDPETQVMAYKAHEAEVLGAAIYARQVHEALGKG